MGALPRPDLPPGAHRDLVDALHDLHHRAGWPSLRRIAAAAQYSHTTVSAVFSTDRPPSWDVLAAVVTALDGDEADFHARWLAATTPADGSPPPPLAGRREELATLHGFARRPDGLFLVLGQPGIGKTRLLDAVVDTTDTTVLLARALPLSRGDPLMPIAALLRTALRRDDGTWMKQALAECPPFVRDALALLLPEIAVRVPPPDTPGQGEWARQRLFSAVSMGLAALAAERPTLAVLDDLHWADATTLDYLEFHLAADTGPPLLTTWRTDDPDIPTHAQQWRTRITRHPTVDTLRLVPLTAEETADQLTLLGVTDPAITQQICDRSAGLPLYTELLARHGEPDDRLPQDLADLLVLRLSGLGDAARRVATTLAVLDRPTGAGALPLLVGRDSPDISRGLRDLAERHLLRDAPGDDLALGHPLLAEALRQQTVATELLDVHRRVARVLEDVHATGGDTTPAEIAQHWRAAGELRAELAWRIRAAQSEQRHWALGETCAHWTRAFELWPADEPELTDPPLRRSTAQLAALTALFECDRPPGLDIARQAVTELDDRRDAEAADILRLAAQFERWEGDPPAGTPLLERSAEILRELEPSAHLIETLFTQWWFRCGDRGDAVLAEVADISGRIGDPHSRRLACALMLGDDQVAGDSAAFDAHLAESALDPGQEDPDPVRAVRTCVNRSDALLVGAASADDVLAAAEPGLAIARQWHIEPLSVVLLRCNVAEALFAAGRVDEAAAFATDDLRTSVEMDLLRGRTEAALQKCRTLEQSVRDPINRSDLVQRKAEVYVWAGRPALAVEPALTFLTAELPTEGAAHAAPALISAARALADLHASHAGGPAARRAHQRLTALLDSAAQDPFAPLPTLPARRPLAAQWAGELHRLDGHPDPAPWLTAARQWDHLQRPHAAAYCRWRAAQAAAATGHGTQAARLVRRALADARTHVPLRRALAEELSRLADRRSPSEARVARQGKGP